MTLAEIKPKQRAKVIGYSQDSKAFRHKLLAMGLTRGVEVEVVRIAPLGDPIELCLRGFALSLRKSEALALEVEYIT